MDLFFIVGAAKSGTTWLQTMLDQHDNIVCKGESHFVDIFYLELSRQLDRYNNQVTRQGGITAHLKSYGGHVDTLKYQMNDANYLLVVAMALMFSNWLVDGKIEVIGEKTPGNIAYIPLLSALFPKARFVHIVRDPRDCATSGWFFQQSNIDKNKRSKQTFEEYAASYAEHWRQSVSAGRVEGMKLDERYIEVYFEDLISVPSAQLVKLLSFLDVKFDKKLVDSCIEKSSFKYQSGGRSPGVEHAEAFLRKGIVGDWQNHFDSKLHHEFYEIAGDAMTRFGYRLE